MRHVRNDSERELVKAVLANRPEAFRRLIQRYQRLVAHVIWPLVPSPEDRQDLAQDIFYQVYRHLPSFRFECRLSTWIARIAYNTALKRRAKNRPLLLADLTFGHAAQANGDALTGDPAPPEQQIHCPRPSPEQCVEAAELRHHIQNALLRLPPRQRMVVVLYHWQNFNLTEISQILEKPLGTVKSDLFRARRTLKIHLETVLDSYREKGHASH